MDTQRNLPQEIVHAIQSVVGAGPVTLHEPRFRGNEWVYLKECLDSTFVSSVGKFVDRFEDELAAFTGAKRAVSDSAFQHRNQFLTNDGKVKYLTIPFVKQNYLATPFRELKIADSSWGIKHSNFLINNYKKNPFFDQIYPVVDPLCAFRAVNVEGTLNLARRAAAVGVKRFVFVSSVKVNGEFTRPGRAFAEADDAVQRLCGNLQVDISKARSLLGWVPPVSVEQGLLRAAAGGLPPRPRNDERRG